MGCGTCGGTRAISERFNDYDPEGIPDPLAGVDGVYRFTADDEACERYHGQFLGTTVFVIGLGTEHEAIFLRQSRAAAQQLAVAHQLSWMHLSVTDLCHDRVVAILGG